MKGSLRLSNDEAYSHELNFASSSTWNVDLTIWSRKNWPLGHQDASNKSSMMTI